MKLIKCDDSVRILTNDCRPIYEFSPRFGLAANIEFPSEWHEEQDIILSWSFIWGVNYLHIPCWRRWPDDYQCSGPRFGFSYFDNSMIFLYYGNDTSKKSKTKIIDMPWMWQHKFREDLTEPETHPYTYILESGEKQERKATIHKLVHVRTRWWLPSTQTKYFIDVEFDNEVGERTGSWKGGCIGCGYEMNPGETPLDTLRRMEKERKF